MEEGQIDVSSTQSLTLSLSSKQEICVFIIRFCEVFLFSRNLGPTSLRSWPVSYIFIYSKMVNIKTTYWAGPRLKWPNGGEHSGTTTTKSCLKKHGYFSVNWTFGTNPKALALNPYYFFKTGLLQKLRQKEIKFRSGSVWKVRGKINFPTVNTVARCYTLNRFHSNTRMFYDLHTHMRLLPVFLSWQDEGEQQQDEGDIIIYLFYSIFILF